MEGRRIMKNVITIAGSDCSGGAGIQADIKTMCAHGVFGMSAITALTVQNTQEVRAVMPVPADIVQGQIEAVFDDIRVDAVKVGMVVNADIARAVAETLLAREAGNIVVDPVMVSKSGGRLIDDNAVRETMRVAAVAKLITPNMREAALLAGIPVHSHHEMERAARVIQGQGVANVLVKGGGSDTHADDFLLYGNEGVWLRCARVPTRNLHGAGCSLSSAIACGLALGKDVGSAVEDAKKYITQAIRDSFAPGKGGGPLGHLAEIYRKAGLEEAGTVDTEDQ